MQVVEDECLLGNGGKLRGKRQGALNQRAHGRTIGGENGRSGDGTRVKQVSSIVRCHESGSGTGVKNSIIISRKGGDYSSSLA